MGSQMGTHMYSPEFSPYKKYWILKLSDSILKWSKLKEGKWTTDCQMNGFNCDLCVKQLKEYPSASKLCSAGYHSAVDEKEEVAAIMVEYFEDMLEEYLNNEAERLEYIGPVPPILEEY